MHVDQPFQTSSNRKEAHDDLRIAENCCGCFPIRLKWISLKGVECSELHEKMDLRSSRLLAIAEFRPDRGVIVSEVLDSFQIEWHGNTVVVTPASSVESLNWDMVEQAADLVMEPLDGQEAPMVIVDLSRVGYFGSVFLALLLRCHKFVKKKGGELVLCGASAMALELLRITALDTIWAIYTTRDEAMQALLS